jgi:hypothetical protein
MPPGGMIGEFATMKTIITNVILLLGGQSPFLCSFHFFSTLRSLAKKILAKALSSAPLAPRALHHHTSISSTLQCYLSATINQTTARNNIISWEH